jgi:hypothetical protein
MTSKESTVRRGRRARGAATVVLGGLVAALLVGAVVFVVSDEPDPAAEARLTLTTAVVWPFYDAVRQELRGVVTAPETQQAMATAATPATVTGTRVRLAANQSLIDVRVSATTEEAAQAALSTAIDAVVAADVDAVNRQPLERLGALDEEVAALRRELDSTAEGDPERQTLALRYYQLLAEADEIRAAVASPRERVAVLAGPDTDDGSGVPARNALVAGVVTFLGAVALLRAFGPSGAGRPQTLTVPADPPRRSADSA